MSALAILPGLPRVPRRYYALVASLPRLVHFERAERLPINRERLDRRLRDLTPSHFEQLLLAERLVEWRRQPHGRTDAEVVRAYPQVMARLDEPCLRDLVAFRMEMRTLVAALRRRAAGEPAPAPGEPWGVPPRAEWVRRHWEEPEFGLGTHHPWLADARALLEAREARALERLLFDVVWRRLERVADDEPFSFDAVVRFVFRWDLVARWLAHEPAPAVERFRALIAEAMGEQQPVPA